MNPTKLKLSTVASCARHSSVLSYQLLRWVQTACKMLPSMVIAGAGFGLECWTMDAILTIQFSVSVVCWKLKNGLALARSCVEVLYGVVGNGEDEILRAP